eukprot:gene2961-3246_t
MAAEQAAMTAALAAEAASQRWSDITPELARNAANAGDAKLQCVNTINFSKQARAVDSLRHNLAAATEQEAAALAGLQGQVGELASSLSITKQQLAAAEAGRKADVAAVEERLGLLHRRMADGEAATFKRMTGLLEARASEVAAALSSIEQRSTDRADAIRSVLRVTSYTVIRLVDLSAAVAAGRVSVEGREVELREEINAALKKMRAYARDMEESLDRERLRLEEVLKAEIKARKSNNKALSDAIRGSAASAAANLDSLTEKCETATVALSKKCDVLLEGQRKLYGRQEELAMSCQTLTQGSKQLMEKLEQHAMPEIVKMRLDLHNAASAQAASAQQLQADAAQTRCHLSQLRQWFDANQSAIATAASIAAYPEIQDGVRFVGHKANSTPTGRGIDFAGMKELLTRTRFVSSCQLLPLAA